MRGLYLRSFGPALRAPVLGPERRTRPRRDPRAGRPRRLRLRHGGGIRRRPERHSGALLRQRAGRDLRPVGPDDHRRRRRIWPATASPPPASSTRPTWAPTACASTRIDGRSVPRLRAHRLAPVTIEPRDGAVISGWPQLHYRLFRNEVFDAYRTAGLPDEGAVDLVADWYDVWKVDLPDEGFLFPGDRLHYCFVATDDLDGDLRTSIMPADTTGFSQGRNDKYSTGYDPAFIVRALPGLQEDPLNPGHPHTAQDPPVARLGHQRRLGRVARGVPQHRTMGGRGLAARLRRLRRQVRRRPGPAPRLGGDRRSPRGLRTDRLRRRARGHGARGGPAARGELAAAWRQGSLPDGPPRRRAPSAVRMSGFCAEGNDLRLLVDGQMAPRTAVRP